MCSYIFQYFVNICKVKKGLYVCTLKRKFLLIMNSSHIMMFMRLRVNIEHFYIIDTRHPFIGIRYVHLVSTSLTTQPQSVTRNTIFITER